MKLKTVELLTTWWSLPPPTCTMDAGEEQYEPFSTRIPLPPTSTTTAPPTAPSSTLLLLRRRQLQLFLGGRVLGRCLLDRDLAGIHDSDLLGRRARLIADSLDLLHEVLTLEHAPENHVTSVQPGRLHGGEEKLRAVRARARVGHGEEKRLLVLVLEVLVRKLLAVDRLATWRGTMLSRTTSGAAGGNIHLKSSTTATQCEQGSSSLRVDRSCCIRPDQADVYDGHSRSWSSCLIPRSCQVDGLPRPGQGMVCRVWGGGLDLVLPTVYGVWYEGMADEVVTFAGHAVYPLAVSSIDTGIHTVLGYSKHPPTGSIAVGEVAALDHEVGDDTVEGRPLVVQRLARLADALLPGAKSAEVLGRLRNRLPVQTHQNPLRRLVTDLNIEVDLRWGIMIVDAIR